MSGDAGGTSGATTSGGRRFWVALALMAAVVFGIDLVNIWTILHDAAARGHAQPVWRPALDEFSSGLATLAAFRISWTAVGRWPPSRRGWPVRLGGHVLAVTLFSAAHFAGMMLIRLAVLAPLGRYGGLPGLGAWGYEYPKDLMSYALQVIICLNVRRLGAGETRAVPETAAATPSLSKPATFDIRDGARLVRTPIGEILAAVSAGNYVEFRLADGRAPLMRTTLAAVEAELAAHGFARVHRSWLVNAARVREVEPLGSGDHRLTLEGGVEAPASRRYAEAIARLR